GEARVEVLDTTQHLHPLLFPVHSGEEREVDAAEGGARESGDRLPLLCANRDRDGGAVHRGLDGELLAETRGGVGGGHRITSCRRPRGGARPSSGSAPPAPAASAAHTSASRALADSRGRTHRPAPRGPRP